MDSPHTLKYTHVKKDQNGCGNPVSPRDHLCPVVWVSGRQCAQVPPPHSHPLRFSPGFPGTLRSVGLVLSCPPCFFSHCFPLDIALPPISKSDLGKTEAPSSPDPSLMVHSLSL